MIILNLIQNVALLVALAATYQVIGSRFEKETVGHQILSGLLFGGVGIVGMMTPIYFSPGIIFDGRSIILSVAGLFGGPLVAAVAATMCGAYRIWLGGGGAWVGVSVILESAGLGVVFYFLWRSSGRQIGALSLWLFGLLVHVIMLAIFQALPGGAGPQVLRQIGLPILVFYPLATMVICQIFLDYEKQLQAKKALRQSEELQRTILSTSPVGIGFSVGRSMVWVNDAWKRLFGFGMHDESGLTVHARELYPTKEEFERVGKALYEGLEQGQARETDATMIRKDGTILEAHITMQAVDPLDPSKGTIAAITDITDRKKAEKALKESESRFRGVVENAAIGIDVVDQQGRFLQVNGVLAEMLGYTEEELMGLTISDISHSDDQDFSRIKLDQLLQGETDSYRFEKRYVRKDGLVLWADVSVSAVRGPDGVHVATVGVISDITDRKRAEQALRESEHRYRSLYTAMNEGLGLHEIIYNAVGEPIDYRILDVNPSYETITGISREKAFMSSASYLYETESPPFLSEYASVADSGEPHSFQAYWEPMGKHFKISVFSPEKGKFATVFEDITERKKTEDALRESEARFKHVFESANVGKSVTLLTGEISVNKAFCDMLGYSEQELRNTTWQELTHPEEVGTIQEMLDQLVKGEKDSVRFNKRYIHKNGSYIWADASVVIRRDHGGEPLHFITTAVDITERKRAEEALRESEQRYRAVVDNLQIGISVINRDMEIIAVNPFFHRHYPHVRPLEGQLCHEMYNDPPSPSPCSYCPCIQTFQDGLVHESVTETPAGGRIRNYRLVSCPVKDGHGNVDLVIELVEDITERRSLQAQLAQAQKMEAVGTLAGGVAHDFNNVLQVALGFSELILGDEELPQHYRTDVQKIYEAGKRGADLVQRLLTFSRKTEIKPQPLDLNVRITELRKMLERTLPKMVDIQLVQDVKLAKINADKTHIDQVLMNLAVNARDAMPDGGKLSFETANVMLDEEYASTNPEANPGPHVLLTVTDTGSGMEKDTLEHIFEPFYTTKQVGEGTGLGLAMVHGIVKQHGGHIRCYSEPGHGTTFKIYFPALVAVEEPEERTLRVMPRRGSETVLLVDDEALIRDLGSRILTKAGYKVITSSDGEEALTIYQSRTDEISLVVLDVIMPVMGGKQCLEALLRLNPSIKIVIASGFSSIGPAKDALSAGAKGFVNKPYDMRQMLEVVREVLDAE